jgi:manganese/zinc/iron transport system substrate-binding protein
MIGDLAARIGGDDVELVTIMPAGVDPHTYKPSTADLGRISRADLVFYNGLHLEGKMVELFEDQMKARAVPVSRDIPHEMLLSWQAGSSGAHDPHIWFDVKLWSKAAATVGAVLAEKQPAKAETYRRRTEAVVASLLKLDAEVREKLGSVPKERRVLITSHDAYNYFGKAYDVQVRGLQGISTESEAGLSDVNGAVDFIVSHQIPAIFVESSVSPKTIERVRADCKTRGWDVRIGGELYSDAMGRPNDHAGYAVDTYEGMVRYNVDTLVNAMK